MRNRIFFAILLCLITECFFSSFAHASMQSLELEKQGIQALERKEWFQAMEKFHEAEKADPNDKRAVFLIGVTLNRMERFLDAITKLSIIRSSFNHPEMDFEMGLAYMGNKLYNKSIESLESYEKKHPGRGQTKEILARSYIGLGQYDKAKVALTEARRCDSQLEPIISDLFSIIEEKQNPQMPLRDPSSGGVSFPTAPAHKKDDRLNFSIQAAGGYNDNVIALGNSIPLPSDITKKGSAYEHLALNLNKNYDLKNNEQFTLGYALMADRYDTLSSVNLLDHFLNAEYMKAYSAKRSGSIRLSNEYTTVGGNRFRNQITLRPALTYRFTSDSVTEFSFGYRSGNYLFDTSNPAWNRDGFSNTPAITHYFFNKGEYAGSIGYSHTWNQADGADYDFQSDCLSCALSRSFGNAFTGEVSYQYSDFHYDNANTLSLAGSARRDTLNDWAFQILKSIGKDINMFVQYNIQRALSNIPYFAFKQNVWNVGLIATY